jgi:radical SAM protein with 4Fe4S-binding SPASM domain
MDETHDLVRGTKNALTLVSQTLRGLIELRNEYPNFFPGIKTTILPQNIDKLNPILDFSLENGLFHIISPVFFTGGRFRNLDTRQRLTLADEDFSKLLEFYRRPELDAEYFYYQARCLLSQGKKEWECTAGYNYLFIEFDGQVYPCELTAQPLGNLREQSIESIWNSPSFKQWRDQMSQMEACRMCCEPGAVRYSACDEGSCYRKFLIQLGKESYHKSLTDEGYVKYLT